MGAGNLTRVLCKTCRANYPAPKCMAFKTTRVSGDPRAAGQWCCPRAQAEHLLQLQLQAQREGLQTAAKLCGAGVMFGLGLLYGGGTPGPAWEADACVYAVLQHILRTLQPHWPRSCADTRLLCFSVTPCVCSLFSQRRGLGRKEGKEGGRRRRRGRDHQDVQPSRFSPSPGGDLPLSPPHLTFLWPVSLGGQVLFEIREKKKDEVVCPTEQSCFHTVPSVAGCESGGERRYC